MAPVPLMDWDESIYAQVSQEIVEKKTLEMTYNDSLWVEKPPFMIYLMALVMLITSQEVWLRFISLALTLVLLVSLYVLTKNIVSVLFKKEIRDFLHWQKEFVYMLPVLFLLSSTTFLERTTLVNYDIPLALGWVGYFMANTYGMRLLFLSIGVLSKSLLGYFPVIVDFALITRKNATPTAVFKTLLLLILPFSWHIISFFAYGQSFIQAHFVDHLIKRVVSPIELHFGGRLFYAKVLWGEYSLLLIIPVIGYALLAYIAIKHIIKTKALPPREMLILGSPLVFFTFLTFSQTKIWWYIISFLPIFALITAFTYMQIRARAGRILMSVAIVGYFIFQFSQSTLFFQPSPSVSEKIQLARCLEEHDSSTVAFLVDEQERQNKQVFEAAQIGISSSFIYGGSPAFVYYSGSHIDFYYDVNSFKKDFSKADIAVITKKDLNNEMKEVVKGKPVCETEGYIGLSR